MALEFVLGRVRRDIRLNGSFMAHCCPTTSFRPMAGKAELFAYPIRQVSEWSGPLNVLRSSWGNGSSWPAAPIGIPRQKADCRRRLDLWMTAIGCTWRTRTTGHYLPLVVTSGLFAFDRTEWQVSGDQIDR